jgi:hypothetical protein
MKQHCLLDVFKYMLEIAELGVLEEESLKAYVASFFRANFKV